VDNVFGSGVEDTKVCRKFSQKVDLRQESLNFLYSAIARFSFVWNFFVALLLSGSLRPFVSVDRARSVSFLFFSFDVDPQDDSG